MDHERLAATLEKRFGHQGLQTVVRQAGDLADSGRYADDIGADLSVDVIVSNLQDAPDGYSLVERWNWWVGSLDLSYGGYQRFHVREDVV
jgi:hypothetical protein